MAGRNRKAGKRVNGRLSRAKLAIAERNPAPDYIINRRQLFAFATPSKGPDGRHGEIDQDICDGIGQLHVLGLLDGNGIDPKELRDAGRFYGEHYWTRYRETAPKTGKYERADKSVSAYLGETAADRKFDRMDEALQGFERHVLMTLVVDTAWGDEIIPWAQSIICEELLKRGKLVPLMMFPTCEDREMLKACVRGLCVVADGGMEYRRAA